MANVKKRSVKAIGLVSAAIMAALLISVSYKNIEYTYMDYAIFISTAENGGVDRVTLAGGPSLRFTLTDSDIKYETDNPRSQTLKEELLLMGVRVDEGSYISTGSVMQTVFSLCFLAAAVAVGYRVMSRGKSESNSLSAMNASTANGHITFDDVAGNDEAKASVADIVDFIKNPQKYALCGARLPRGIILHGPPGTGKTLLARAMAGEAGVPFSAVSGSDFVQMYVGVGAARVRELFKAARAAGKAVIFIDEIDALGRKRSSHSSGGADERDQTLNALLTEMSGFSSSDGVIVVAATNRLDVLDEALLRPGRFDRQVFVGLPDKAARLRILTLHAANKSFSGEINMEEIASMTVFFSGAMLENLLNEAAILAAKDDRNMITRHDMDSAYITVVAGGEKMDKSGVRESDRRIAAIHESGHALAARLAAPENAVPKLSIIPGANGTGGFCLNIPPDRLFMTRGELEAQAVISLAGRAAEELMFGIDGVTTGAGADLAAASRLVSDYIFKYGMAVSDDGSLKFHSDGNGAEAAAEHSRQLDRLYGRAKELIRANIAKLNALSSALIEKDTLGGGEIDKIIL